MNVTWVLIADRSQAQVMHWVPELQPSFITLARFSHPESRLQQGETETNKRGRFQMQSQPRSAFEPQRVDRAHLTAHEFGKELVEFLEHSREEGRFDQLVVVAPPLLMGVLRDLWPAPLQHLIIQEFDKDLTKLPAPELESRLADEFSSLSVG